MEQGGGGQKEQCNSLACALFTITKKCLFCACLTNAVQKKKDTRKILHLCSLGGWHAALRETKTYDCKQDHV